LPARRRVFGCRLSPVAFVVEVIQRGEVVKPFGVFRCRPVFGYRLAVFFHRTGKQVVFFHDEQFVAVELDGLAAVFAEQDAVADLHGQCLGFALVIGLAGANGQDFALVWLFCGGIGNEDTGSGAGFAVNAFDDHAVGERTKVHRDIFQI
jgi:hypothetical protein